MKTAKLAALLISAATVLAAAPAVADEVVAAPTVAAQATPVNGPKTRAEVKAELARAKAAGEMDNPNEPGYPAQLATGGYTVPRVQISTPGFFHTAEPVTSTALN
jgi:hypothetical protein